jgi:prevent-host-death family protein
MRSVGVHELEERAIEIVRRVRDDNEPIDITDRGEVVARLVPVPRQVDWEAVRRLWDDVDRPTEDRE